MPFTLAHPAAILPFGQAKRLSFTAMVIGSMVPDFEFFFQMREVENIGHHWYGVLFFDLPVTIVFCFVFHLLLRNLFIMNLPAYFYSRLSKFLLFNWSEYATANKLAVIAGSLLGIGTHLFIDAFTHYDGFFVAMIPLLAGNIVLAGKNIPVYFFLQILLSLTGMILVAHNTNRLPAANISANNTVRNKMYWPLLLTALLLILIIRILFWPQYNSFWGIFMAVMGAICYSWLIASLLLKKYSLKKVPL